MYKKQKSHAGMRSFQFLLSELRQYKSYSVLLPYLACITQIITSLIVILLPKFVLDAVERYAATELVLDATERHAATEYLWSQILMVGILLAIITVLNMVLHNSISSISQQFLFSRLTSIWEKKAIHLDYPAFLSEQGKLAMEKARQVISSPNWGCVSFLQRLTDMLEASVGLVVYCLIVGSLHPLILLFLIALFGIELLWGFRAEKKKQEFKNDRARADRKLNYMAYGTRGMTEGKDIRIFSMRGLLQEISRSAAVEKRLVEEKTQRWQLSHMAVTALLILVRDGFCYLYLIQSFLRGAVSIGDFTLFFAAITGVGEWLTRLSNSITSYIEVNNYVTDFRCFLELSEAEHEPQNEVMKNVQEENINTQKPIAFCFENVSFSYQGQSDEESKSIPVISHMDLSIYGGEKIALVGANGAGKSTFIKLLCGMLNPEEGKILVNGQDIRGIEKQKYFRLFAAVFQKSQLLPVSVADNIMQGGRPQDRTRMWECIRMAGLERKVKSLPKQEDTHVVKQVSEEGVNLSGGQEQRLFLARALYKDAPVLILDEPTAALDPIAENDIYQKYNELTKEKTAVFVSHRLSSTRFCDRILFMENGEIAESGSHEELMRSGGKYAAMFAVQSEYYQNTEQEKAQENPKDADDEKGGL